MARTRFHALIRERIEEVIERRSGSMASGACSDYPAYRENVGYIKGLIATLEIADDVEKDENPEGER